jgi:hypothetical protein
VRHTLGVNTRRAGLRFGGARRPACDRKAAHSAPELAWNTRPTFAARASAAKALGSKQLALARVAVSVQLDVVDGELFALAYVTQHAQGQHLGGLRG